MGKERHGRLIMEGLVEQTQVKKCHLFDNESRKESDVWDLSSRQIVGGQGKSKTSGSRITQELRWKSRHKLRKST